MNDMVPVFLVTGILDSGKTRFIKDVLSDPEFNPKGKNLIIACEEGEEEYNEEMLKRTRTTVCNIDDVSAFTSDFLKECQNKYRPHCVIVEYNGMWPMMDISNVVLPKNWTIGQTITLVDAGTFSVYWNNMRQQMNEKFSISDYVVFTRCTKEMDTEEFDRAVHKLKPRADIDFIYEDGTIVSAPPFMPFDLHAPIIDVPDDFFYDWYMHSQEEPEKYEGKTIRFKAQIYRSDRLPKGYFVPGRFVMNCCANDIQFKGYLAKNDLLGDFKQDDWVLCTAKMKLEYQSVYRTKAIVLYPTELIATEKPEQEVAT